MSNIFIAHEGVGHLDNPPGRGSGRYGWGTGENPGQHQYSFISEVKRFRKKGMKDSEIAKALLGPKATTTDLRAEITIERTNQRMADRQKVMELLADPKIKGNKSEVARIMGFKNESNVRKLLDDDIAKNTEKYMNTADYIRSKIDEKGIIQIGPGTEYSLGINRNVMDTAISILEKEGYIKAYAQVPDPSKKDIKTTIAVLCPPGTEYSVKPGVGDKKDTNYINWTKNEISLMDDYSPNQGKQWQKIEPPSSMDSSRIMVRYKEDGGADKDGVMEIRRGVSDLSLGNAQYAQVRIAVDGTHYLKGMAMYADDKDMPKGVDIIFNTNKKKGTPMIDPNTHELIRNGKMTKADYDSDHGVLKPLKVNEKTKKVDEDNPFGALIKAGGQNYYEDKKGEYVKDGDIFRLAKKNEKGDRYSLSPINKLREEGDWDSWSKRLSMQFLSKQPVKLINQQIDISVAEKKSELADIMKLTNPVIKKKLLEDFANNCDSNANDLSVKGFKKQAFQVILPITNMKDTEIYAPNYKDGDTVALIRYPHGGTFEIPILKVNNKQATAKKIMPNARDAVGINPKTAAILSGADFDGDTVVVIPLTSNRLAVKSTANIKSPELDSLKSFDPKMYKLPDSAPPITNKKKQTEMGKITNLITDMTAQEAPIDKVARAVKHSMVVIDSEKHHLNMSKSFKDNRIQELKNEYQHGGGASTIFSRSNAEVRINERREVTDVKKMTLSEQKAYAAGKKVYHETGATKTKRVEIKDPKKMDAEQLKLYESGRKVYKYLDGVEEPKQTIIKGGSAYEDSFDLVFDKNDPKERAYANYGNTLKDLANQARKEMRAIKPTPVSQSAKKTYAAEVEQLNRDLRIAESNKPRERQAKAIAAVRASEAIKANPDMDYEHKNRIRQFELDKARAEVGAKKEKIVITDREWEAIQANAISTNKLTRILNNTDQDDFKKRATPKDANVTLTSAKINLIKTMYDTGMYTQADIAEKLGVSASTISKAVRG
jgi:hypothetical protein